MSGNPPLSDSAPEPGRLSFDWLARAGALTSGLIAAVVFSGWMFDVATLDSMSPGSAEMKANTAIGLLVASFALLLMISVAPHPPLRRNLARLAAVAVTTLGLFTLVEYPFSFDLGFYQALVLDRHQPSVAYPGRVLPPEALSFLTLGLALLCFKASRPSVAACAHWLAIVPLLIAGLTLTSYVYGVGSLTSAHNTSMTQLTSIGFVILLLALLAADSQHGLTHIAASASAGGMICRRLLPTLPPTLIALGWLTLEGQHAGLYDANFGRALMVILGTSVCVIAIGAIAIRLHSVDSHRKVAENSVADLNTGIERRVYERTQELAQLSEMLSTANKSLEALSLHDSLTGLANRRFFDIHLGSQVTIARRGSQSLALVLCDVDSFKAYNDLYGHQAGDECLKQVATALLSCCSRPADMAARYGGEEFALILPDTGLSGGLKIADAMKAAVARLAIPHAGSPAAPYVTISGGIAILDRTAAVTAPELIAQADTSLFDAKRLGRNQMISSNVDRR